MISLPLGEVFKVLLTQIDTFLFPTASRRRLLFDESAALSTTVAAAFLWLLHVHDMTDNFLVCHFSSWEELISGLVV